MGYEDEGRGNSPSPGRQKAISGQRGVSILEGTEKSNKQMNDPLKTQASNVGV
jgi:hypothetical protein